MALEVQELIRRTRQGGDALLESVLAARNEPERIGYLAAGELSMWARIFGWQRLHGVLKPTLLPLLAGTVARSDSPTGEKVILLVGLAAGWLGGVEKTRTPDTATTAGLSGVAGQHLVYSRILHEHGARASLPGASLRAGVWVAGIGLAAWKRRQLAPAATVAGAAVAATSALANDPALRKGSVASQGLGHGANLVLVSEGLTLLRAAVLTKNNLFGRLIEAGTAATATIGHMLLVDGLVRR